MKTLKMIAVSVVIPTYNAEKTIIEAVNSVLLQTLTDWELIIINDGSIDSTLKVLEQFSDPRIQIFTFKNAGPQKSRNRGIEKAKGTFISFLDSDDFWTADKLELQVQALQSNPEASVVYSWCDVIDEKSEYLGKGKHSCHRGNVFLELLVRNFIENGSNFMTYLAAIKAVGGFDERIIAGQDRDISLSLAKHYQFDVVPKVQVLYRKSRASKSWSSNIQRVRAGIEQVINKHTQACPELLRYKLEGLGNAYKHMVFECLNNHPTRSKGTYALNLLWLIVKYDPSFMKRKVFWKILARVFTTIILPSQAREFAIQKFFKVFDINAVYVQAKSGISDHLDVALHSEKDDHTEQDVDLQPLSNHD